MPSIEGAAGGGRATTDFALSPHPEPFFLEGDGRGVLLIHGFTGSPHAMRYLGEALHAEGFTVGCDVLPGHEGDPEAMFGVSWARWYGQMEVGLRRLRERCDRVGIAALSMGAALALRLMRHYGPENIQAGALLAPAVLLPRGLEAGLMVARVVALHRWLPTVGRRRPDIADPAARAAYPAPDRMAVSAGFELVELMAEARRDLRAVRQPMLVIHSRRDHTIPFRSAQLVSRNAVGSVRLVPLHRSHHVITVDRDRALVAREVAAFLTDHLGTADAARSS